MAIQTRLVVHEAGEIQFECLLAWDDTFATERPGVLVSHTIRGRTEFEEDKARQLAGLGYVAMAVDIYGANHSADNDRSRANMEALLADRAELQQRMLASLQALATQPEVDESSLAAVGFCFGGLCVLDLVRVAAPVRGVVSFHGLFTPPGNTQRAQSAASVLVLHGWDDPLATPDSVVALGEEMTALGADWQIHAYGHTVHAFTNPAAADSERGAVYHPTADRRSWTAMINFLAELFG